MAYSLEGLLGKFRGRIDNLIIYESMGKTIIRRMPTTKRPKATGPQKQVQEDFARVMKVLQPIKEFVRAGFQDVSVGRTAFQSAISVNLKRYRQWENKNDLHWLLPSQGSRAGALDASWQIRGNEGLVRWGAPPAGMIHKAKDIAMILVVNASTLEGVASYKAIRNDQQATIPLPVFKEDEKLFMFLAFRDLINQKKDMVNVSMGQLVEQEVEGLRG